MNDTLPYTCPHCDRVLHIKSDRIGEEMTCEHCQRPFVVPHPEARPVHEGSEHASTPAERSTITSPDGPEETLEVVHPVMVRARPLVFFGWLIAAGVGLVLLFFGLISRPISWGPIELTGQIALVAGGIIALAALGVLAVWWLMTRFRTLTVTDERTIYQKGIIARQTSELRHDDVRNLKIDQSFLQRIFGVGRISISSAGQDEMEIIAPNIPHPETILEIIRARQ